MRKPCQAVAKATGGQCKRPSIRGSRYCWHHIDRTPLIAGAVLGALLSLLAAESFRWFVPSEEILQLQMATNDLASTRKELAEVRDHLDTAQQQRDSFEARVGMLDSQLKENATASGKQNEALMTQLERVETQLEPFVELALKRYPGMPADDALARLKSEIQELRLRTVSLERKAAPRRLSSSQAEMIAGQLARSPGRAVLIQFDPTDVEARQFGNDFVRVLSAAGWTVDTFELMAMAPQPGLLIYARDTVESRDAGLLLHGALTTAGLEVGLGLSKSAAEWTVVKLYIGPKGP